MHNPFNLCLQRNPRSLTEPKSLDVLSKPFFTQLQSNFGSADVGGFGDDLFSRQNTVGLVIAQPAAPIVPGAALAIEHISQTNLPFIKSSGYDDDLESGPRFGYSRNSPIKQGIHRC